MADIELKIAEGLIIQPGDTLIVRVDPMSTFPEVEELKRQVAERLPAGAQVMVIACEQLAVMRPDSGVNNG
jgi:hypothetical protein